MQSKYEERIKFLRRLDIFEDIDMYILLPLASNIKVKRYKMGEYIVRAGEMPDGLIIVTEGQCIVCAEKLALRSTKPTEYGRIKPLNPNVKTNPTGSSGITYDPEELKKKNLKHRVLINPGDGGSNQAEMMRYFSESLGQVNSWNKSYQNEQILLDDKGKRTKDFTVYKDLVSFATVNTLRWSSSI
jgi:hypothetical protein